MLAVAKATTMKEMQRPRQQREEAAEVAAAAAEGVAGEDEAGRVQEAVEGV